MAAHRLLLELDREQFNTLGRHAAAANISVNELVHDHLEPLWATSPDEVVQTVTIPARELRILAHLVATEDVEDRAGKIRTHLRGFIGKGLDQLIMNKARVGRY